MDIYDLINRAKRQLGSNKKVAEKLNVNTQKLSNWKHGRAKPEAAEIMQLAIIAELNPVQTLFIVMEKIDTANAELWKVWRPYDDVTPNYRRA